MTIRFRLASAPEDRAVLWAADDGVARVFVNHCETLSDFLGVPSGISGSREGYEVDARLLEAFVAEAITQYEATDQGILRSLIVGSITTALVLLGRAAGRAPAAHEQAVWIGLRDQLAVLMPR